MGNQYQQLMKQRKDNLGTETISGATTVREVLEPKWEIPSRYEWEISTSASNCTTLLQSRRKLGWTFMELPAYISYASCSASLIATSNTTTEPSWPISYKPRPTPAYKFLQQRLQNVMAASSGSSCSIIGSTSVAKSGTSCGLSILLPVSRKTSQNSWVLDLGAIDHMTPTYSRFISYELCAPDKRVATADGTHLQVIGIGSIRLEPIGLLTQVLHVPKQYIILVSVQRFTRTGEYRIIFDNFNAFLYNKVHGWTIRLARICQGLYHLLSNQ